MSSKRIKLLTIVMLGYGVGLEFIKYNSKNDGSIKKYSYQVSYDKHTNPFLSFTVNYDYRFVVRLFINRE